MDARSTLCSITAISAIVIASAASAQSKIPSNSSEIPSSTSFVYQGQLSASGKFATSADVRFTLFDSQSGGTQIGPSIERTFAALPGGSFATTLDFGPAGVTGQPRWLEISVRAPAGYGQ